MRSRIETYRAALGGLFLASAGCNQVLGIHEATGDDWDGASGITTAPPANMITSGTTSGASSGSTHPVPTASGADHLPPPTDAGTTLHAWADWPMPNPPSTGLPNAQSYDASTSGIVFDKVTGLSWQHPVAAQGFVWSDARAYCASLMLGGGGWRLPSRIELLSLVDFTAVPTINPDAFPNTPMDSFWSGSLRAGNSSFAWSVNFGFTVTPSSDNPLNSEFHVRCVR